MAPITQVPFEHVKLADPVVGAVESERVKDCPGVPNGSTPPLQVGLEPPPITNPPDVHEICAPPGQFAGAHVAPAFAAPHTPVTEQVKLAAPMVEPVAVTDATDPGDVDDAAPEQVYPLAVQDKLPAAHGAAVHEDAPVLTQAPFEHVKFALPVLVFVFVDETAFTTLSSAAPTLA